MTEAVRQFLYPLALISQLFFGLRMALQWWLSEKAQRSATPPFFWHLSIAGNLSLMVHSWLQLHYPLFALQACNGLIAWRNLNLNNAHDKQLSPRQMQWLVAFTLFATLPLFALQGYFTEIEWLRSPSFLLDGSVSPIWHIIGCTGLILSSTRFWLQWWSAEKAQKSYLGANFWWTSLLGALISTLYFIRIGDPINAAGPAFALVPYTRNLVLLMRSEKRRPLGDVL